MQNSIAYPKKASLDAVMKSEITSRDVTEFYRQMDLLGIEIWIDGGWDVDALL